jgi:isopenicillin-N N-acyltransferase-like protein
MLELKVQGTPYERGRQIGEAYADRLRAEVEEGRDRPLRGWTPDRAEAATGNILFALLRHAPHYVEELRGLADGAGIDVRDAFVLNTAPAYQPLRAAFAGAPGGAGNGKVPGDGSGCTNLAIARGAAGPVLVKTVDGTRPVAEDAARLADRYVFLRFEPAAGDEFLPYAMVCQLGRLWPELGMNAAGLAAGQSSVPPLPGQRGHGIPVQWILRPALEHARTAREAVELLARLPMTGKGMNVGLVDAGGGAAGVEKCHDRQAVFWPEEGWVAVTNAYRSEVMADALPSLHPENSAARLRAIRALFAGPLRDPAARTEAAALGLLRFHATDPDHESICQHGGGHGDRMYTHHGFLLWPRSGEVWASAGPPCRGPLERFDVRHGYAGPVDERAIVGSGAKGGEAVWEGAPSAAGGAAR